MSDPAAGKFECPGGHLEQGESARAAAIREWQEETGLPFVDGEWTGTWTSPDGIYQGFVYTIEREADLDIFDRQLGSDPDGDVTGTETIAWWDPADLPGNPAVRSELLASVDDVMAALGCSPDPACCGAECCSGGCCNGGGGCACGAADDRAVAPCPCCGGSGEHSNGCECLYCDASGTAIDASGPVPCEGALDGTADVIVTSDGEYSSVCPCGTPVVYDEMNGWQHADGSISHDDGESVSDKMAATAAAPDPVLVAAVEKRREELAGLDRLMRTPPGPGRGQRVRHRTGSDDHLDHGGTRAGGGDGPKGPGEVRKAALDLANLTGVWAEVYGRREKLLRKHAKAVSETWDACVASLGSPRDPVRAVRSEAAPDAERSWWKDTGTAAALAWLDGIYQAKGYPALLAAIEDAIREGMAEGEADALALAADRQGVTGFAIGKAFTAASDRLQGDPDVSQQAQDVTVAIVGAAAAAAGKALADQAGDDGSEQDMTSAATDAVSGTDSPAADHADWTLWSSILAGAAALYSRVASSGASGTVELDWITAGDGRVCATCQDYADNGPYTPENLPGYPHNRCRCSTDVAVSTPRSFLAALLDWFTG